ncbi:hypothetical protein GCM10010967_24200 [Dyadobacter beijingensis]|uniref:Cytochrome C Planctomycete-type domain-containing protein n=2 Tax=Dyadobacter beijingensis TaxID=365489 RepID=A0ABQ2HUG1_9BACT|nr:hypothetical protein GCM10010967_24200 [Dyadobacter beijingensis]
MGLHKWFGIALAVLAAGFYLVKKLQFEFKYSQLFFVSAFMALLTATGHYGGALTHGEDFLKEPVMAMVYKKSDDVTRKPITDIDQALVYKDLVEPVLERKCFQCHNAQKKKGDLRLDTPELLLRGGEHGKVLVAGKTSESELFKRLLLPEEDPKRMPPKGKIQLNEQEIALLHWWIQTGGSIDKQVGTLPKDERIKTVLAGMQDGRGSQTREIVSHEKGEFLAEKIPKPHDEDLAALVKIHVAVDLIGPENGWVSINAVNHSDFDDQDAQSLLPLRKQAVWLKLNDTRVTDGALQTIGQLTNLTRLNLENTVTGDAGVKNLAPLAQLQYLNLVGTEVTDAGLEALKTHKQLKRLYLWQSKVTLAGIENLRKALPDCEINFGEVLEKNLTSTNSK